MRILIVHNYTQRRGGADEAAEQERALLEKKGHAVFFYTRHNDEIKSMSWAEKLSLFFQPTWSHKSCTEIQSIITEFRPDILHCHSFFPLVSPAIYYIAKKHHLPVVQTLHEYRLVCASGQLIRNGSTCEECITGSLMRGIRYSCYHNSKIQTASASLMLKIHRWAKTWETKVDCFINLTEFSQNKLLESGIPQERCYIRPNFLSTTKQLHHSDRTYALYVGRLSTEKGIETLLKAWNKLPHVPLKIIGDGPMRGWAERYVEQHNIHNIDFLGFLPIDEVLRYQRSALFVLLPSLFYETFGRTIMEAYSVGTPVIASNIGAITENVVEGETGLLFTPGDANDLAKNVRLAINNPRELIKWGIKAHKLYQSKFTAEIAYQQLVHIYAEALNRTAFLSQ